MRLPPYLEQVSIWDMLKPPRSTHHWTKAMHSKATLSAAAKIKVVQLDFQNAVLICSWSSVSYRRVIVSSRVRAETVRNAPIDSVANLALSAKTALFIFANWVSYRIRKKEAAIIKGIEEQSVTMVSFHPK